MPTSVTQNQQIEAGALNLDNLLRVVFDNDVPDMLYNHGNPIFRLLRPGDTIGSSTEDADEGGRTYQMLTGFSDSVRSTMKGDTDFPTPRRSRADKIRVRFNPFDDSINDINRFNLVGGLHVTGLQKAANSPDFADNTVQRLVSENIQNLDEAGEMLMHSSSSGQIGVVNGDRKANNNTIFAAASAYTNGMTSARILVDEFSIGVYKPNRHLDFYNGDTMVADEVRITDVNYEDFSVGLALTDRSTVANLDGVLNGRTIFRSSERQQGFKCGFGELFKESYANDNWIGGTDRNAEDKRHFQPIRTRVGAASTSRMSSRILNTLVRAVSHYKGMDQVNDSYRLTMGMEAADNWSEDVDNAATATKPASGGRLRTGVEGLEYIHPAIGTIGVVSTRTARNDRAILWLPSNFQIVYGDFKGVQVMTSGQGTGMFERVPGTGVNGGGSTYYRYEALTFMAPLVTKLNTMACAFNIE